MVTFSRSNDINALVSGDIQFDLTAPDKVVHSALGGFPVKMVMGTARGLNLALTVHPSIRSAADLQRQVGGDHRLFRIAVYRAAALFARARHDQGAGRAAQYRRQDRALRGLARQSRAGGDPRSALHDAGGEGRVPLARRPGAAGCSLFAQHRRSVGENPARRLPARWRALSPGWPRACSSIATRATKKTV